MDRNHAARDCDAVMDRNHAARDGDAAMGRGHAVADRDVVADCGHAGVERGRAAVGGRYARQLTIPGFGEPQQRRLRGATAVVAGVGGVGGAAATYLAAAGVGRLSLVHPGVLELEDLNRQTLMLPAALGSDRVGCAARTLRAHHPDVEIDAWDCPLADERIPTLLAGADVVVDARHNFEERYLVNRYCVQSSVPLVVAGMSATEAQLLVVSGDGPCLRCVFSEGDPSWDPLGFPVLGAVAGTVGCLAAMEAIKILTGYGEPMTNRLLAIDLRNTTFRTFRTVRDPGCPDCGRPDSDPAQRRTSESLQAV